MPAATARRPGSTSDSKGALETSGRPLGALGRLLDGLGPGRSDDGRTSGRARRPMRRRPGLAVAGALLVLACGAIGADVATRTGAKVAFLVASREVAPGTTVTPADLSTLLLSPAPGLDAIPASDSASVIGRSTTVAMDPGSLVVPGELETGPALPTQMALVGASLADNQMPATLAVGDHVLVVLSGTSGLTASSGSAGASASQARTAGPATTPGTSSSVPSPTAPPGAVMATATVITIASFQPGSSGSTSASAVVTLEIPDATAGPITAASAAGDISLAMVGGISARPAASGGRGGVSGASSVKGQAR